MKTKALFPIVTKSRKYEKRSDIIKPSKIKTEKETISCQFLK